MRPATVYPSTCTETRAPDGPAWTARGKHVYDVLPGAVHVTVQDPPAREAGHASFALYPQAPLLVAHSKSTDADVDPRTSMLLQMSPLLPVQRTEHAWGAGGHSTVSL